MAETRDRNGHDRRRGGPGPRRPDPATRELARGLGWFSLGLGLTEIACGDRLARWLGMPEAAPVLRAYGVREILQGVGILNAQDPAPWLWGRVAGDALDIATVLPALTERNPRSDNARIALAALAGVTVLDVACARRLSEAPRQPSERLHRDYRTRSGFPRPPGTMRGAAHEAANPLEIVGPQAMRPWGRAAG